MSTRTRIESLLTHLNEGVYEKQQAIRLSLLSAIAGESIFLLGAPGVAKSLVARKLKLAFKDARAFEYLMNRFSTPDEIFGPVAISKLKNEDKYERKVTSYLPDATVVFLDEIWKAGPSIQNSMLTILNEKKYRNGEQEIDVPMKALISASNELPAKNEGLEALWDRFLIRLVVEGISEQDNFNKMISAPKTFRETVPVKLQITDEEYKQWSDAVDEIIVPENVLHVIQMIRSYVDAFNAKEETAEKRLFISDRRWKKIVRLMRTSAFLNDRKQVDLMDCFLIKDCIWNEPGQAAAVSEYVMNAIQKHGYSVNLDLTSFQTTLSDFFEEVKSETSFLKEVKNTILKEHDKEYYYIPDLRYFIRIADYNQCSGQNTASVRLYQKMHRDGYQQDYYNKQVKRTGKLSLNVSGTTYKMDTTENLAKTTETKAPHPAVKRDWDKKVQTILTQTSNLTNQLDHFRTNDLKHLRLNLFVDAGYAQVVETNLNDLQNEIGKLEIEAKRIQHYYETVEDHAEKTEMKTIRQ